MARLWPGAPPSGLVGVLLPVLLLLLGGGGGGGAAAGGGGGGRGSSVYPAPVVYPHHSRQISWNPRWAAPFHSLSIARTRCRFRDFVSISTLVEWNEAIDAWSMAHAFRRVFLYEQFLSYDEASHLVSLARAELKRSAVADNLSGKSELSDARTSSGTFISKGKDPIVAGIEEKIAAWTFLPKENGEDIQVLRYKHGEKYEQHYDYFADNVNTIRGGHRIATVLMYLTDVAEGGETVFPLAEEFTDGGTNTEDATLSECARKGVAVKPRKGDALLFFNLSPDASKDSLSLHAGCPVIKGEKWSATKWIHVASFDKVYHAQGNCTDNNESCAKWAALGECKKNPEYMVGTAASPAKLTWDYGSTTHKSQLTRTVGN
ncbi:hypothetical protein ABZP36_028937 [Zizania latifolia]